MMAQAQTTAAQASGTRDGQPQEARPAGAMNIPFRDNVVDLLEKVRSTPRRVAGPFAIMFSFDSLSHLARLPGIVSDFYSRRDKLCALAGGDLIQVSETDFVLFSEQSEFGVVGAVTDIKMVLLKVIAHHAPDAFSSVDQNRLIRVLDLSRQRGELFKLLEASLRRNAAESRPRSNRALSPNEQDAILQKIDALTRQSFVDQFARFQPIAILKPQQQPIPALQEWFVSMSALQQKLAAGINLQLNQPLFKLLTLELDQRMLDCLARKHIQPRFTTFNFNIETIFTRKFEELGRAGIARHLIVEVRASDVFEDFDRFILARKQITDLGGRIAIDNVRPSMLGVLNAARLGCDFIKVFVDDLQTVEPLFAEAVREVQESGTRVVFARIESQEAIKAGMMLGVEVFQGFYIDTLMKDEEERSRFVVE